MNRRERYNASARQSAPGSSRKKGKRRQYSAVDEPDPNALIYVPKTEEEKEDNRRERLRQELAAQSETKWSRQKRKRLEKYIDKKLQKEERVEILKKLADAQAQIPTSLDLQSSATLGTGRSFTIREQREKEEDLLVRRAIGPREGDYSSGDDEFASERRKHTDGPETIYADSGFAVGSSLKQNGDGSVAGPVVQPRPKKHKRKGWGHRTLETASRERDHSSDTSFDSSDSAYDTSSSVGEDGEVWNGFSSDGSSEVAPDEPMPLQTIVSEPRKKLGGFKEWALRQLGAAKPYMAPSPPIASETVAVASAQDETAPPAKRRKLDAGASSLARGPLGEDLTLPSTSLATHILSAKNKGNSKPVIISRTPSVVEARALLPVVAEEQPIMEAIRLNPVVVICGETGSGKTTQVPQFLYEAGFGDPDGDNPGMIGITQPRRVAAISMAHRVGHELSLPSRVAYQVRYDSSVARGTAIKFMTDGVLLRELATDFMLTKYSAIIVDEAHERSINTDILIGVLSRVVRLREELWKEGKEAAKPLRLIIMSATLRVTDFTNNTSLFPSPPPVVNVNARQHPVTVHFSRCTTPDYVNTAIRKAGRIHARLPPGGILIFLTGQNEISGVCRKLEARYGRTAIEEKKRRRAPRHGTGMAGEDTAQHPPVSASEAVVETEEIELGVLRGDGIDLEEDEPAFSDADALESDEEDELDKELMIDPDETDEPMHVLPLYSLLSSEKQMRVFEAPPAGCRLVVVATNVAETSLTIPGIRYVIDCGRAKERHVDHSGIQHFQVNWISKASAEQRAGRAGRTGPGHCYRLYSSSLFETYFSQFATPEILRTSIDGLVLQMKSMNIDTVVNFPFPTAPDRIALEKAERSLSHLGALDTSGRINELGVAMSQFPLSPRFSRMLVGGRQHGCLPYVVAIVAALSAGDPFLNEEGLHLDSSSDNDVGGVQRDTDMRVIPLQAKESRSIRRKSYFQAQQTHAALGNCTSDIFKRLSVIGAYEYAGGGHEFCVKHFVHAKIMEEIRKLRKQISDIASSCFSGVDPMFAPKLPPPSALQIKVLRQLLAAGFIDQVAVRKDLVDRTALTGNKFVTSKGVPYKVQGVADDAYIHPSSILSDIPPPDFIVYNELLQTSKLWLKGNTIVNAAWLASLGKKTLCTFSAAAKNSKGIAMVIPRFGSESWELPPVRADSIDGVKRL